MVDNGLIKYYRSFRRGKRLLDANNKSGFSYTEDRQGKRLVYLHSSEGSFYRKVLEKPERDAEILLSQLYAKAGLKSAIYLPIGENGEYTYVISNDIESENVVMARDQDAKIKKDLGDSVYLVADTPFYLPEDSSRVNVDYFKYITKEGMKNLQLKRLVDVGAYNTDGHDENYFYTLENGLITDVISIDFAMSGRYRENFDLLSYYNEFVKNELRRDAMMRHFKENESLHYFVTPDEMAETIGAVDVVNVAKDIKSTIGYKISHKYTDEIASSFEDMAEQLIQP